MKSFERKGCKSRVDNHGVLDKLFVNNLKNVVNPNTYPQPNYDKLLQNDIGWDYWSALSFSLSSEINAKDRPEVAQAHRFGTPVSSALSLQPIPIKVSTVHTRDGGGVEMVDPPGHLIIPEDWLQPNRRVKKNREGQVPIKPADRVQKWGGSNRVPPPSLAQKPHMCLICIEWPTWGRSVKGARWTFQQGMCME